MAYQSPGVLRSHVCVASKRFLASSPCAGATGFLSGTSPADTKTGFAAGTMGDGAARTAAGDAVGAVLVVSGREWVAGAAAGEACARGGAAPSESSMWVAQP